MAENKSDGSDTSATAAASELIQGNSELVGMDTTCF